MAELTARQPSWTDYLPGNVQQAWNTNPVVNMLAKLANRPTPDLERRALETYGTPEQRDEADRNWLIRQAQGPSFLERNPAAADGVNKLGFLANFLAPGVRLPAAAAPKPTGIRAYHGSPHDFDKFDISKIGTGEGAQAYGRGLYFAESEGVAKSYRDDLSRAVPFKIDGRDYEKLSPLGRRYAEFVAAGGDLNVERARALKALDEANQLLGPRASDPYGIARKEIAEAQARLAAIDEIGIGTKVTPNPGRMYEVRINADPEQFLDWDKPLSQQPEGVRAVAKRNAPAPYPKQGELDEIMARLRSLYPSTNPSFLLERGAGLAEKYPSIPKDLWRRGEALYRGQLAHGPTEMDVPTFVDRYAAELKKEGIPGIKYLDQGSRAAGQGSRNYVVFDDKLIEILRKYGIWPLVPAGTAATLNQQEPPL